MSSTPAVKLVSTLPRPLLNFFKRHPPASATQWMPQTIPGSIKPPPRNPFHPTKNTVTGKYNEPIYSVRRQTDLTKLAKDHGLEHLLPRRVDHKEKVHATANSPMRGLVRWKGTKMERTRSMRRDTIQVKLKAAKEVVRKRRNRSQTKKRRQIAPVA